MQSKHVSHLAVQSPNCRSAAVGRSSQSQREKLGAKFHSGLGELVKQGGQRSVNDKFLLGLGIMLPAMRQKIFNAVKRRLICNKQVRFGEAVKFEPILNKKPRSNRGFFVRVGSNSTTSPKRTFFFPPSLRLMASRIFFMKTQTKGRELRCGVDSLHSSLDSLGSS